MKLTIALVAGLVSSVSAHAAVQAIDCRFTDASNTDHVIVTLNSDQAGTFYYSTGEDEEGSTTSSGKLILKRGKPVTASFASFLADVTIPEGSGSVQFTFEYPEASLMKAGNNVKAKLTTEIFGIRQSSKVDPIGNSADTQDLLCVATLK